MILGRALATLQPWSGRGTSTCDCHYGWVGRGGTSARGRLRRDLGLDDVNYRILTAHNAARADVGAPPLQWDPSLAIAAASYGPALSKTGRLVHSPRAGRENQRENLWMGQDGRFGPEQMVAAWTDEKRLFFPGAFPNVSKSGNWADVAHYTQMIWKTTTHVGCAIYRDGTWDYLICRYTPPGNRDGKAVP